MATLLYSMDKGDPKAASEFITRLLNAATMLHLHHLTVTGPGSYAKHTALAAYGELVDLVDGLAESWMGCTGQMLAFKASSVELGSDPYTDVKKVYDYVESARGAMGTESHIQNDIDGILTLLSSVLYKLQRLA